MEQNKEWVKTFGVQDMSSAWEKTSIFRKLKINVL